MDDEFVTESRETMESRLRGGEVRNVYGPYGGTPLPAPDPMPTGPCRVHPDWLPIGMGATAANCPQCQEKIRADLVEAKRKANEPITRIVDQRDNYYGEKVAPVGDSVWEQHLHDHPEILDAQGEESDALAQIDAARIEEDPRWAERLSADAQHKKLVSSRVHARLMKRGGLERFR